MSRPLLGGLLVVLFAVDLLALAVLRALDLGPLLRRDLAVGERLVFHFLYARLAFLEPRRFLLCQRARLLALLDAPLLVGLALVDARRALRLRQCGQR